ncbi:hypothetical protein ABIC89_000256 [Variovorax boronicumulans]|uniref:hypothetical protein n=1 Tax=Variovorax boronicumulans TaxID=436515 RepID=UPI00339A3306
MEREYLFAAATLAICLCIAGVSLCRLRLTDTAIRCAVRVKYVALGGGAVVFGFAPWTGTWPGWTGMTFAGAVLVGLLTSSGRWRQRAPLETRNDHNPSETP